MSWDAALATFGASADWRLECTGAERRAVSSLLRDAVPPPQRARLWRAAVGIASRQFGEISAELFEALSEVPTESSGAPFQEKQKRQAMIQTDLRRTFPHLGAMFSGADSPYAQALVRVLDAYARLRPDVGEVGYVQGMSYLAAMVLWHGDVRSLPAPPPPPRAARP